MKNLNLFEKLWEHSRTLRRVGLVLVMCIITITQMWAYDAHFYLIGSWNSWSATNKNYKLDYDDGYSAYSIYWYLNTDTDFALNNGSTRYNPTTTTNIYPGHGGTTGKYTSDDGGCGDCSWKYTGNPGIVKIHVDENSSDKEWRPWVWVSRPTVYIRHKWNDGSWSNQTMTDNNDGTYTYIGQYSGSNKTNVGPCESCGYGGDYFKYFSSATLTGSPAKGDRCLFTYNSSGFRGKGGSGSNTGSLTITKLCTITYHGNSNTGGSAPAAQADIVYNTATVLSGKGTLVKTGYVFVGWNTAADGSGTFYLAGATINPTASITLYAQWLSVHTPGVYETAVGSGGYGQTLVTSDGRDYEVYQYAYSTYIYVYAGTSTTSESAANCMLKYAVSGGNAQKNWMLHSGGVKEQSSYTTHSGEFQQNAYELHYVEGNTQIIVVSGYDQFSLYGRDKTVSSAEMQIYINGTKKTLGSTSYKVGRWDLDPSTTYTIRITATGSSSNFSRDVGFSLRVPLATCTAPTGLSAGSVTAKGATFTVTDAANTNNYEIVCMTTNGTPAADATPTYTSTDKTKAVTDLVAGTKYYAWVRSKCSASNKSDWVSGGNFTTNTVTVTHTLTNVTKTSGATTAGGSDYTAVFTANTGYSMPNPTVTIGGNAATSGTHYTWSVDGSVGTITIPANKINGNIVITMNSAATAPSSVSITGNYHIYPGETLELTATPTGGNGPKTYQWQKYMGSTWTNLAGETSNTYTKASVTTSDVGHYRCIVTCGGTASTTSGQFDVKCLQLYVYYNNTAIDLTNLAFTKVNSSQATATVLLGNSTYCYHFKVTDGCGNWWGNNGESGMSMSNHDNWPLDGNYYTKLWTSKAGTYRFNLEYNAGLTSYTMSVVYPSGTQAAGYNLYFANEETQWNGSKIYYRVGKKSHNNFLQMTLVSGTANLYKVTTTEYGGFEAWHIANNRCGGNSTSIYKTNTDDAYEASAAMMFNGTDIPSSGWTVIPDMSNHWAGTDDAAGCEFYGYNTVDGMKTDRVTISDYSHGTITVNYTNTSNVASSFTSGYADLAHTCIITPTATASTGYKLSGLTVNGSAHTSGSTYTVTAATTVAATFAAKQSAITFDKNGGTGGATGTTGTYGSTMTTVTIPTRLGYTFDGYWDAETGDDGSGTQYYNTDGTSARTWDKDTESATTLYAKWVAVECPAAGSGETVFKFVPVTSSSDNVASSSGAELTTSDYLSDLVNGHVYAYGSSASNVTMTSSGVKVASSTGYLKLDFDCALIAGDQIKWKSDQNSINLCNTTSYNSSNDLTLAKSNSSYSTVDITSAMVGKQTLYLVYNTGVATMIYFEIIRPEGYSVTYKANGGTGSDVNRIDATAASLATVGFTRAGYDFTGWKTGASSGTDYKVGDEITEEITLYAQWTCVTPTFGTNLSTSQVDYEQNATASALTVAATANGTGGNGTVGYQWYSNTANSTTTPAPTILTGKTSASYTPSTEEEGTTYYFCRVTNTSSGCATTTDSKIAKIVVSEAPCFKFVAGTTKAGSGWDVANNGSITTSLWSAGDPVLTGGTMTNTSGSTISAKNKSSDTHYGLVYAADGNKQVTVTLSGSHVLAEDAVITINGFSNNTTTACGFKISGNDMSPATYTPGSAAYTAFTQTYKVTAGSALEGASSFTVDQATSVRVYLKSITVTGCAECTAISPTLTAGTTTLYTYPTATSTTLTLDKGGSSGTVTWESSDASIASVSGDGTSATVTAVGTGSATITASIAADGTYCAKSVSETFTVTGGCGSTVIAGVTATSGTAGTPEGTLIASSSGYGVSLGSNIKDKATVDGYKIDGSKYMYLTLSEGNYFKSGDEVLVYIAVLSDIGTNSGIYIYTGTTVGSGTLVGSKLNANLTANTSTASENSIILSNVPANTSSIIIPRTTDQNAYIKAMKVRRYVCPEGVYEFNDAAEDGQWSNTDNWVGENGQGIASLPTISNRVIISKPVEVDVTNAKAAEVIIDQKSPRTGTLTIKEGMALIIADKLQKTTTGTSVVATDPADVIINSTRTVGTGALIIGQEDGTNQATVNFETKVKRESGTGNWINQYVGSPFSDNTPYVDYALQLYKFCPKANGDRTWWATVHEGDAMTPFWGYDVLYNNNNYLDVTWTGTLNASTTKTINGTDLYYNGSSATDNMFANSWTAPIHVGEIEDSDVSGIEKTFYLFNAGTPQQDNNSSINNSNTAAGTYVTIPFHSGQYAGIGVIPAMQAFYVVATASSPSLTLDYEKIVYTPALTSVGIQPNRAPKRSAETAPEVINLHVQSETGWAADTYVMGRADFAEGYEDGWDGAYIEGESPTPKLYTPSSAGDMFINCLPEIEGTVVGFRKGSSDNNYIFSFDYDGDEVWYLNDQKAQKSTQIMNGQTYAFVSEAGDNAARFVISATPINKIATGCESVGAEAAKVRKLIINDKVYIIRGGQVFDVLGKTIKK